VREPWIEPLSSDLAYCFIKRAVPVCKNEVFGKSTEVELKPRKQNVIPGTMAPSASPFDQDVGVFDT
jgi:hypothetical protein